MATIKVTGNAVVITSALTVKQIETAAKYRPQALLLLDEDKNPVFAVGIGGGTGSITKHGAVFSRTADAEGRATITLITAFPDDADRKEFVADLLGNAVLNLNKLEATLPAVLGEVAAEKAAVLEGITIA